MVKVAKGTRSHNLFTTNQVSLQAGEIAETDLNRLFVNASAYDYRPRAGSPAINSGTTVPVATDIDGVARPHAGAWDIGAYEFTGDNRLPAPGNLRVVQ